MIAKRAVPNRAHVAARAVTLAACVALVAIALLSLRFARQAPRRPPIRLVLLYAPCTVSKAYLSPYRSGIDYTPALQQLAGDSVVFERHHTEAGKSGVAYAALFTGTDVTGHGVFFHPTRLPDSLYLLPEALRDGGYETFYWNRHMMAAPHFNYTQGVSPENVFRKILTGGDPDLHRVLDHLAADPTARALIVATFSITHAPYNALYRESFCKRYPRECEPLQEKDFQRYEPLISTRGELLDFIYDFDATCKRHGLSPAEVRRLGAVVEVLYKSNINALDRIFGAVLDQIRRRGLLDESLIVFTADHGEVLQRENATYKWTHGFALAPEVLQVPLLIRGPGIAPGTYENVTESIDVFPTVAGLLDLPAGKQVTGTDLSRVLLGEEAAPEQTAFFHTALPHQKEIEPGYESLVSRFPDQKAERMWVGARAGDLAYKLTNRGGAFRPEVYDWATDPQELHDLYDPDDAEQTEMFERLAEYRKALIRAQKNGTGARKPRALSAHETEALRQLGYIDDK